MNQHLINELRDTFIRVRDAMLTLEAGIPRGELLIAASNLVLAEKLEKIQANAVISDRRPRGSGDPTLS
jgi:hypothetical protein